MARHGRPWYHYLAIVIVVLVVIAYAWPLLSPILPGPTGAQVTLMVNGQDANDDSAFTPAGASVKMYVWPYGGLTPAQVTNGFKTDIPALALIGAGTETPDGEYSTSATTAEGSFVYVYITDSGNTYYTCGVVRKVPFVVGEGISREAILDPITVYPRSATPSSDTAILITTGGVEKDNTTNMADGDYNVQIAITSGKAYGSAGYIDPATGYSYLPAHLVFDLTITTARMSLTGGPLFWHGQIGSNEYWCYEIGQSLNDADITGDGLWQMDATLDVTTTAADVLDIYWVSGGARYSGVVLGSFGTKDYEKADNMLDVHLA